MPARRESPVDDVPPALRHYLECGCWRGGLALSPFIVAGNVLRGNLDGLRQLWRVHGDAVKRHHRGETFVERVLRDGVIPVSDYECREHHTHREDGQSEVLKKTEN